MEILLARTAGFCFGVKRALEMAHEALASQNTAIFSLGPLIHNPGVVQELSIKGLKVVNCIEDIPGGRVVIRSHGVGPQIYQQALSKNLEIIDATCPFVKNVQQLAVLLHEQCYQVIIIGEREHAEVKGVLESVAGDALVVNCVSDLNQQQIAPKVGVISQTTQEFSNFQLIVSGLLEFSKEIRIFNTICLATSKRQQEVAELSQEVERMIIVGGKNSANTSRLLEISRSNCIHSYQVETAAELKSEWFIGVNKVGVSAGASTPDQQIDIVLQEIKKYGG
ncbi:MAG TPA: 4-hydroxy-3-methylbut-2-enyl diphosphate reductase [Firmicutes bacterium]|jgi:(E)-4-hydroxy-3-methyl-but-2-enyl pyrophosphate reductase|nr:4-hydroxy-3-methylbut-2-enyl diphosphate reductase [Bacillota bacterium]